MFRSRLGLAPRDYIAACRRRGFLHALREGANVTQAVYEAGYGSASRVYGGVQLPGMTPATYGRGGRGARIDWTIVDSNVGSILVAATTRGLCFVEVGAGEAELLAALRREYPLAGIAARPSSRLRAYAAAARAVAEAKPVSTALPVDIRGTAFQWRVWRALTRIPRGETRSYAAIAAAIGRPAAARAVARACATNPLSLVVPCHRVVRGTGQLGGYRWGLDVKKELLTKEGKSAVTADPAPRAAR
jgi:AraC family transcriptional regulator of adaptative response/methylated-DNA-[protein]-cysteine methyltransferase